MGTVLTGAARLQLRADVAEAVEQLQPDDRVERVWNALESVVELVGLKAAFLRQVEFCMTLQPTLGVASR